MRLSEVSKIAMPAPLFHGTDAKAARKIMSGRPTPAKNIMGVPKSFFVTRDRDFAAAHALRASKRTGRKPRIVELSPGLGAKRARTGVEEVDRGLPARFRRSGYDADAREAVYRDRALTPVSSSGLGRLKRVRMRTDL